MAENCNNSKSGDPLLQHTSDRSPPLMNTAWFRPTWHILFSSICDSVAVHFEPRPGTMTSGSSSRRFREGGLISALTSLWICVAASVGRPGRCDSCKRCCWAAIGKAAGCFYGSTLQSASSEQWVDRSATFAREFVGGLLAQKNATAAHAAFRVLHHVSACTLHPSNMTRI